MSRKLFPRLAVLLLGASLSLLPHGGRAQSLDEIGVTSLHAVATNLNGAGISVAQPEADVSASPPAFEVVPWNVGCSTNLFTFAAAGGTSNVYPNSFGTGSWHADGVAELFYSPGTGVATNVAHVDNFDANYYLTNYVFNSPMLPLADLVVNQSFTFGNVYTNVPTPPNELGVADQQAIDSAYDAYSVTYGTLFVSAVNNGGDVSPPGTAYNTIGVACCGASSASSVGPTVDNGRCKPDITAPGPETSYSTPQVAGAAALLLQAGTRGDGGADTNSATDQRTIKALLLNGAVKTADWTNSPLSPLDARYGAGVLNVLNSYEQMVGGRQDNIAYSSIPPGGAHPPLTVTNQIGVLNGWDFSTNTSSATNDSINHYFFTLTNRPGAGAYIATATLVWNRQLWATNINQLALYLYQTANSNLVTCSTSLVDNVQHFRVKHLVPGTYDLQVWKAGGTNLVSTNEPYAVAFAFTPIPVLGIQTKHSLANISWPAYPSGYGLAVATNLGAGIAWNTNGIPAAAVTNGMNVVTLPGTNRMEYFHLVSPNF